MNNINSSYGYSSNQIATARTCPSQCGCPSRANGNASPYGSFSRAAKKSLDPVQRRLPGDRNPVIRWARNNPQIKWVGRNFTRPVLDGVSQNVTAPAMSWLGKNVGKPVADQLKSWGIG